MNISELFDPYDTYDADIDEPQEGVMCKRCGEGGLSWVDIAFGKWRLMDEDCRLHYCKPSADDFDIAT